VILIDANLLIYAHFTIFPQHARTREWLDTQLSNHVRVGMPWDSLLAFLRITTNRRSFSNALSIDGAWKQVRGWLDQPSVWIPEPTAQHAEILGELLLESRAAGDLVPDVHLAALAIEHGLTLCTNDRDFARFPKLRWMNPLTENRL